MFSEPVVGEKFFGRDDVLEILRKRALALKDGYRQNVALTGQSLAGKSSIILHFLRSIQDEGFIPIYVEVVKEPFSSFARKFIATLLYNALLARGQNPPTDLADLMEKSKDILPRTACAASQIYSLIENEEYDQAYSSLLELTSVMKAEINIPCIVILDEFDNLEHLGIKNPFSGFGKVIMVQKDTMYIISSSRNLAIKKIISEKLSLLFGNFEVVKVSNFGIKASCEFLDTRLGGFEIEDFTRKFLLAFTDGNPFYLSKLASSLKSIAMDRMKSFVGKEELADAILDIVYNANGVIHQYLLNYLLELLDTKRRDIHISVLVTIANGINRRPDIAKTIKMRQREAADTLAHLCEIGLITKNGVFYSIDDVMLEFWLKNVYKRKKDLLIDGTFDKVSLFREEVLSYMTSFEQEYAMSASSRIAQLFGSFSNDLVQVDSKSIKLPHFTKVETRYFADSSQYVAASFRGNFWIAQVYDRNLNENDIISFIKNAKSLNCKISNKVIIPLKGMDENTKLLAKELKITIWDSRTINNLLNLYRKKRIVLT
ncbi:MAG: ATP-binding protein [Candidatus Omnitrophica bacterium]|nr:ATP-binding protein [Candidatus Omnitrophota bacterium]MCM8790299.1 ATP-binding protein [Candidatus Omnitrophota bacterium]